MNRRSILKSIAILAIAPLVRIAEAVSPKSEFINPLRQCTDQELLDDGVNPSGHDWHPPTHGISCCHIGCENPASHAVFYGYRPCDDSYFCPRHVDDYLGPEVVSVDAIPPYGDGFVEWPIPPARN